MGHAIVACAPGFNRGGLAVEALYSIYSDIAERTKGDIYIGVVGPVRTGKSTFIKRFMDSLVLPNIQNPYDRERAVDETPQSASGRMIMTTEPKFVPNEAVTVTMDDNVNMRVRLVDCVGYMVKSAVGHMEGEVPRMVKTPWYDYDIPFERRPPLVQERSSATIPPLEYLLQLTVPLPISPGKSMKKQKSR